jgi:hypothetical protein
MCVFNRIEANGKQSTLLLHVDDIFMSADSEATIDDIIAEIGSKYKSLQVNRGRVLDYLGMTFDFTTDGTCKVTMDGYINDLLEFAQHITGVAQTPAGNDLFSVREDSAVLDTADKEFFHSLTAKLLYLGKRVRPDLLTAISYLTKRVLCPNNDDMKKLHRVIRYLMGTRTMGINLSASEQLTVLGYVDASYGVHADMKSHTGTVIGIGRGPIFCKSSTQKINTKSSTESELVGLSDSAGQFLWARYFLEEQGYSMGPAKIYQDNMSTISMIKNGKSSSDRTKRIAIRLLTGSIARKSKSSTCKRVICWLIYSPSHSKEIYSDDYETNFSTGNPNQSFAQGCVSIYVSYTFILYMAYRDFPELSRKFDVGHANSFRGISQA